jgi:DUF4097 and DUF4098 domain-containing protein YvlB
MKRFLPILLLCAPAFALEEKETIRKTFTFAPDAAERIVEVDTVTGSIRVTGTSGRNVEAEIHQTITADTQTDLAEAKREVMLDIQEQATLLRLYVDGPFRNREGSNRRRYYNVRHDFVLKVPKDAILRLSTVNGGDIHMEQVDGNFTLSNVNGAIDVLEAGGSGRIKTVNGGINASFRKSPAAPVSFKTVNGGVEAQFPKNLSADLSLKTFNGEVYSDFDVVGRAVAQPESGERRGTKFVYRTNRQRAARIGSGGPELSFETLNGNIKILQRR